ncbi:hypothetical protein Tco_1104359 [Tanacetum coccineum]
MTLVRPSSPAICCIGPGPIYVYYELSPRAVSITRLKVPLSNFHLLLLFLRGLCAVLAVYRCITSIKCVLTQEHLDAICSKYFVPEEVHPQLPSSDATMHERPAGKVGIYACDCSECFCHKRKYAMEISVSVLIWFGCNSSRTPVITTEVQVGGLCRFVFICMIHESLISLLSSGNLRYVHGTLDLIADSFSSFRAEAENRVYPNAVAETCWNPEIYSCIQVRNIVKEVEDYLKTYSSAGIDISSYVDGELFTKVWQSVSKNGRALSAVVLPSSTTGFLTRRNCPP